MPRRVRELLDGILQRVGKQLDAGLLLATGEFEHRLMQQAEQAKDHGDELRLVDLKHTVSRDQNSLIIRFKTALETELANLREPQIMRGQIQAKPMRSDEMSLVDNLEMDETSVLTDIASRAELRHSLPLYLLGQRFGVLAGRPGFDPETLPIGPKAFCRAIRRATDNSGLTEQQRVILFRAFDHHVMNAVGGLIDAINKYLIENGVLPNMHYVPVRIRATARVGNEDGIGMTDFNTMGLSLEDSDSQRSARSDLRVHGREAAALHTPQAAAHHPAMPEEAAAAENPIEGLLQLLASRRQTLGRLSGGSSAAGLAGMGGKSARPATPVLPADLQAVLRGLQLKPAKPVVVDGKAVPRTVGHLKQDALAALRQFSTYQDAPVLSDHDSGIIDLMGMLYDNLMKDVRPGSQAAGMLSRLQVPLLRASLQDPQFFVGDQHPARQMLDAIANTGAHWLNEEDPDPGLVDKLNSIVDRSAREYNGDLDVFKSLLEDLLAHLKTLTHKAGVAERRHVDAARGKEKLALARNRAAQAIETICKQQKLPRFTKTMLTQAWTDVMALTVLRRGEESDAWQQQIGIAQRLVDLADAKTAPDDAELLQSDIQNGLSQVGYQTEEADAIARRLVDPNTAETDEGSSRTELTMRLKSGARLGEEVETTAARKTPMTAEQTANLERLKQVPFGTWFDFVTNQQGDIVRRRLSWFSVATGHALFVNHRGQKVAEHTLEHLAQLMVRKQLVLVENEQGSLLDRAWGNVLGALQAFTPDSLPGGSPP
jgi:hypothetical protein